MNIFPLKKRTQFLILGFCMALIGGIGFWYWRPASTDPALQFYQEKRDRSALVALFNENWFWLDNRPQAEGLAAFNEHLDKITNPEEEAKPTKMSWLVYSVDGRARGFTSYFMRIPELKIGKILYLAVQKEYRSQGIARKLLNKAISTLKEMGARTIEITVRLENYPAQNLYRSLGFRPIGSDTQYFYMELPVQ
ncbi:MAG: Ribosomal-protein-alanine acetyltransferase [candidate division TM6 bacterium GW2011_GWE2_42_60]|nr:MAG: Ribosomal-protein-alanine acetyltransferase [candidate division TM6 bacterium GW2011_GWE2_42_60]